MSGGGPGGVILGLVGLVRSEIRLARLATRAPALFASVRRAVPQTYDETSKWPLLFIIALVSFVPDTVLFALIPVSLWIHVLLIFVSVYSTVWIAGVYSSTVAMPHVIGPAEVRFYNGVFSEYGNDPAWSPYQADIVPNDIASFVLMRDPFWFVNRRLD